MVQFAMISFLNHLLRYFTFYLILTLEKRVIELYDNYQQIIFFSFNTFNINSTHWLETEILCHFSANWSLFHIYSFPSYYIAIFSYKFLKNDLLHSITRMGKHQFKWELEFQLNREHQKVIKILNGPCLFLYKSLILTNTQQFRYMLTK